MREGYGRSLFEPLLPLILGRDISGEVASVGSSVRSLSVGQAVFGALHPTAVRGTYVDYAILPEDELVPKPESISHVVGFVTEFRCLWNIQHFQNCLFLFFFPIFEGHWCLRSAFGASSPALVLDIFLSC